MYEALGSSCSDGQFCNGQETCNASGSCQSGSLPNCSDGVACTDDSCNEQSDSCVHTPNNALCNDGQFCNGQETCSAAGCVAGTTVNCSDVVACTDDSCNEQSDSCVHTPNNANCPDDGQFCNGTEFCDQTKGCASTGNPCTAGQTCQEDTNSCEPTGTITVSFNIIPQPFNITSKGVLPAAILGTEDFDVSTIDPSTLRLEGVAPMRWAYDDVSPEDGTLDLTLTFDRQKIAAALGNVTDGEDRTLMLTGNLKIEFGGSAITGEDMLHILVKKK